jgi:hypothetical protein
MPTRSQPDERTEPAESAEARLAHRADRPGTPDEERADDESAAALSDEERDRIRAHEEEMAERGAHHEGEGRID